MRRLLLFLLLCSSVLAHAQDKPAYVLYDSKGKKIKYSRMLESVKDADIVMFGEYHNNPIAHWLQLELTTDRKSVV